MTRATRHTPIFRRRQAPKLGSGWGRTPELLAQLYAARGARPQESKPVLSDLAAASALKGIDGAAELLADAIRSGRQITVVGDYDCDGATGTSVALLALRMMGARDPSFLIPDRITMGYGLSPALADTAIQNGAELILTVDNGISALAGVEQAKRRGAIVVITDHHLAPETLPSADAIVNPNQPGCEFLSKNMAGVGVMFSTMLATKRTLAAQGLFQDRPEPNFSTLLDLVAIGTIADVVKLDYNNRILVETGLKRMRTQPLRPGLEALFSVAGINPQHLVASDIAFRGAPRINAAGRMAHMAAGIELLTSDDHYRAREIAAELDALNKSRKEIQADMQEEAGAMLVDVPANIVGLALYSPEYSEGIVGLVAGRIKEAEYRPTVVFAPAHEPGMLKGSARSIPGIHIRDVLANVSANHPGLIPRMGGHAAAAGLQVPLDRFEEFQRAFDAECRRVADDDMLRHVIETDGALSSSDLNIETARLIEQGGPWGQGFSQPLFEGRFLVKDVRLMGKEQEHVRYTVTDGKNDLQAVHFGGAETVKRKGYIDLVYQPTINRFRDQENLQLLVEHAA